MKRKSTPSPLFPQAFVVCFSSLLACACASASVLTSNDSSPSVIWAVPAGTNLLAGAVATPTPATVQSPEATATSWSTLTDGNIGVLNAGLLDKTTVVTPAAGNQIIYALDTSGTHSAGYNITSFDSYGLWNDAGRNQQKYTLSYATASAPTTWISLASVNNGTDSNSKSSHTRLTDTTGVLASNVAFVKIYFDAGQENGYTGFSEFVLRDTPATSVTSSECNTVNTWTLPTGTNLLAAATPTPATTPTATLSGGVYVGQWNTSASWSTLSDGSLGTPSPNSTTPDSSQMNTIVLSNNNSVVTYALDLSGAHSGGYNITAFDSYTLWDDTGRDAQRYSISYSTVAAPTTFTPIAMVDYNPSFGSSKTAHVRLTDATGYLAQNAAAVRIKFENGQENSFCAYSELVLTDTPLTINTLNESNSTNVWTLPVGTNLLGAAATGSTAPNNQGGTTSSSWSTLTDGQLGPVALTSPTLLTCVSPSYGQSVTFPLNLTTNIKGYDLSSMDFYGAWDSGRDDLNFAVSYSTWDSPGAFRIPLIC